MTRESAAPLLEANPYISRTLRVPEAERETVRYNLVICLDDEREACALSSRLNADERFGSYLAPSGALSYTDDSAPWFRMGLLGGEDRDALKKANTRTYPAILYDMLQLPGGVPPPVLRLGGEEMRKAGKRIRGEGVHIGLNTGAGGRWDLKRLTEEKAIQLIAGLEKMPAARLWLLGGPEEQNRNERIARRTGIARIPTDLPIREFCAIVGSLDLLVTSDSLALHVALALGIQVVVFFGPTSAAEIELYGLGKKVTPGRGFRCFYSRQCPHTPPCERFQTVPPILRAVRRVLGIMEPRSVAAGTGVRP